MQEQFVTDEEVQEFKRIVLKTMGISISDDKAREQFTRLIMAFEAMQKFEPIPLTQKDTIDLGKGADHDDA